ncbi:hypothetical protein SLEP1_g41883 [Rubroshorea leprosula]|uniref:NAD-dependent epimerase/dehydratase domain-containing protein n=1 Tax=Rubroshorea leprosula TaxID=152421 RepID=A0AAV5L805_9ROSI|nr:hypothetical protein SLEP1_g41883 [Rubroshorea leprosula]
MLVMKIDRLANLLDYDSLYSAIEGCCGVFHFASPLPTTAVQNPKVELIEPAVKGTLNVLKASLAAGDETCWSDKELQKKVENWYGLTKTEAESAALDFAKTSGLDVVTVCPTLVLGPMLQSTLNSSSMFLIRLLKEGYESRENKLQKIVDVRDVAEALLLAYEKPEAEGRYICVAHMLMATDLVEKPRSIYPHYNYPKS